MKTWIKKTLQQAAWAPWAVFLFYVGAAKGFKAFILYPWLDMPAHFCGGMAITYFYLIATTNIQSLIGNIPKGIRFLTSLGLTAITAIVWEFLEYFSDMVFGTKMNLGVSDTLSDLFFGLVGGIFLIAVLSGSGRWSSVASAKTGNA